MINIQGGDIYEGKTVNAKGDIKIISGEGILLRDAISDVDIVKFDEFLERNWGIKPEKSERDLKAPEEIKTIKAETKNVQILRLGKSGYFAGKSGI